MDWSNINIDNSVWRDNELWPCNLSPINETNPSEDFYWEQENTDLGPLQDCNTQQETPELLPPHVETNHGHQLSQATEPSPGPSRRGRRAKLTDPERKERKRESDRRYRLRLKNTLANLKKQQEDIEKQEGEMKSENKSEKESLLKYIQHLEEEINKLKSLIHLLTDVQGQSNQIEKMMMEWVERQPFSATVPAAAPAAEFFRKLEENEKSKIGFKDFTDLHEKQEYRTVGKYKIPLSLLPIAEEITEVHGDVWATSTISQNFAEDIYILFCATIKEMDELPVEKVTAETMLKWGVAIKNALCINFKVEFAMEHLKETIAPRYFGMKAYEEAEKIDVDIAKLEACLSGLNECKKFIDIAKEFDDRPFSEGLWG